jgi:hypothetical protein
VLVSEDTTAKRVIMSRQMISLSSIPALLNLLAWIVISSPSSNAFLQTSTTRSKISRGYASTTTSRYFFDFLKQNEAEKPPEEKPEQEEEQQGSDDPVDKIFGFFFGQKEEAPMGMKRIGSGAFFI